MKEVKERLYDEAVRELISEIQNISDNITLKENTRSEMRNTGIKLTITWAGQNGRTPEETKNFIIDLATITRLVENFKYNGYILVR